jgi:hypothetical protein
LILMAELQTQQKKPASTTEHRAAADTLAPETEQVATNVAQAMAAHAPPPMHPTARGLRQANVLQMQRSLGNAHFQRTLASARQAEHRPAQVLPFQTKLKVNTPDDTYEQEADQVADHVMRMDVSMTALVPQEEEAEEPDAPLAAATTLGVQRKTIAYEQAGIQPSVENGEHAQTDVETQLNGNKGAGSPLPDEVRTFMEPRFGTDFSQVRVHTGNDAAEISQSLHAQAFTYGSDIYYGAGKSPGTNDLTAHELTHVVQQTGAVQRKNIVNRTAKPKKISRTTRPPAQNYLLAKPHTLADRIQLRSIGVVAKRIQTKADPGQILDQLQTAPPSTIFQAYDQATEASPGVLEAQKQQLQQEMPEIPAPTGLPAQANRPQKGNEQADIAGLSAEPKAGVIGAEKGAPANDSHAHIEPVKPAPPPPGLVPTHLAGGEGNRTGAAGAAEPQDPQLAQSAQGALDTVQLNTDSISTQAVKLPGVDLTGDADPSQMDIAQQDSDQAVGQTKAQALEQSNRDFGENKIFPAPDNETLKSEKELSATQLTAAQGGQAPAVPGELIGQLDRSLGPTLHGKIGEQQQKYVAGQQKFDTDTAQAKIDADNSIKKQSQETAQKQLAEQQQAKADVSQYKQEWQTELTKTEKQYQSEATRATQDQKKKIAEEKQKGEKEADQHFVAAEKQAEQEKQKAHQEANQKQQESKQESGGFWGWVKSKASALIDGLKKAVNFIYDNLRKAVKFVFEQAKKLALAAIELARKAIVGLIKVLGEVLKGLVKVALAAFPEIAKRINAKIDQAVNTAVKVVNTAADLLKKGVAAVLDFLAKTLDSLLGLIQSIYNGALTVIGMIVRGEFGELIKRLGYLVDAAKAAPPQFETAGYEELLGGNLDEPLSPVELAQAGVAPGGEQMDSNGLDAAAEDMPKSPWSESNIGVDGVEENMELSPEMSEELIQQTQGNGVVDLAEANDNDRTMDAVMSEANGEKGAEAQAGPEEAAAEQKNPDDGLSPRQRAEIRWQLMKDGISKWWSDNWPTVLIGATAAIAGFIALNVVTGGAITAALPAIMSVVGPLFIGATIAQIGGHVQSYLALAWDGNIQGGGKSLAKGLAAGAIELISYLTFKAGGAALKGAKAAAKGAAKGAQAAAKGAVRLAKGAANLIAKGAKFLIEKGKVIFKGIAGSGLGKAFQRLKALGANLLERLRFKKFRIRLEGRSFFLEGYINPWIVIAKGQIIEVPEGTKGAVFKTDDELKALKAAEIENPGSLREFESALYKETTTKGRGVKGDALTGDHIPSRAALVADAEARLGRKLTPSELREIRDKGVTVALGEGSHVAHSRTYGGRNTAAQIAEDAKDLSRAFGRDTEAILKRAYDNKTLTNEMVSGYLQAYKKNVASGVFAYSSDIEEMLIDFLKRTK